MMEREDGYAPRGRPAGARGCLDHSQSSRRNGSPRRAQAQSPGRSGTRLRNLASAAPPRSCVRGGGREGARPKREGSGGRGSGPRRRQALGAPSLFSPGPAGGARRRTQREAGKGPGADPRPDRGRSARDRRSSGPRAAGYRDPGLGAGPGPCRRGKSIRVLAPAARLPLQPVGYGAPESPENTRDTPLPR